MAVATAPGSIQFHGHELALERVACDFCGHERFTPFWSTMRHGMNLPTVFCENCGLCMTNPRPTAEALELFYSQLYNRFHKHEETLSATSPYVAKCRHRAKHRVDWLLQQLDRQSRAEVFEIGAGVGQFQVLAGQKSAWQLSGIEPGEEQAAYCQSLGLNVRRGFFGQPSGGADQPARESFDAVVSFHVLEHIAHPSSFLAAANEILRPDGLLYIEVPNLARWGHHPLSEFLQLPHLFNFHAITLRNYFELAGFRVIFTSEARHDLGMIGRKIGPPRARPELERYDVQDFASRLKLMERLRAVTRLIPRWSLLGRVRSALEAI